MSRNNKKQWDLEDLLSVVGFVFELVRVVVNALRKRGGTVDDLRRLLKEPALVDQVFDLIVVRPVAEVKNNLLKLVDVVRVSLSATCFSAVDNFVVDTSPSAVAKVSYLSDNFKNWFLNCVEGLDGDINLSYHTLLKASVDEPIIAELGGEVKAETFLVAIWYLMTQQKNGEVGVLLTNGYANIFYVLDENGVLRAVSVFWYGDGWFVRACTVAFPVGWLAGRRVFSQNS